MFSFNLHQQRPVKMIRSPEHSPLLYISCRTSTSALIHKKMLMCLTGVICALQEGFGEAPDNGGDDDEDEVSFSVTIRSLSS